MTRAPVVPVLDLDRQTGPIILPPPLTMEVIIFAGSQGRLVFETMEMGGRTFARITKWSVIINALVEVGFCLYDTYLAYQQWDRNEITAKKFWELFLVRIFTGLTTVGCSLLGGSIGFAFGGPIGFFIGGFIGSLIGQAAGKRVGGVLYLTTDMMIQFVQRQIEHSHQE